jgi:ferric-dicitrate binding protein FerR (iron transport regulator)
MIELLAKYFSGNASENEVLQVKNWRNESDENSTEFIQHASNWNITSDAQVDTKKAFSNVLSNIEMDNQILMLSKPAFPAYLKYAAILLIGVGIVFFGINYKNDLSNGKIAFQTLDKQTREVILLDESKVYLSENSSIAYVNDFEGATREVTLKGKAFFDVERNENKPFIVRTDNSEIKVLGTSFLVDCHLGESTEVVVKTGKVSVAKNSMPNSNTIELNPGEQGMVKIDVEKSVNQNANYLALQTKIIDFSHAEMSEVGNVLEEVYFVDIKLSDTNINNCSLTAKFDHREIDTVLEIISQTFNMNLQKKGKSNFILSGAGCSAN